MTLNIGYFAEVNEYEYGVKIKVGNRFGIK